MIKKLLVIGLLGLASFGWGQTVHSAGREVPNVFTNTDQFTLGITVGPIAFANLGTISTSTTMIFVSDATFGSSPCTGGGTGALAVRINGAWSCAGGASTSPPLTVNTVPCSSIQGNLTDNGCPPVMFNSFILQSLGNSSELPLRHTLNSIYEGDLHQICTSACPSPFYALGTLTSVLLDSGSQLSTSQPVGQLSVLTISDLGNSGVVLGGTASAYEALVEININAHATNVYGFHLLAPLLSSGAVVTNMYGLGVDSPSGGTVTNSAGITSEATWQVGALLGGSSAAAIFADTTAQTSGVCHGGASLPVTMHDCWFAGNGAPNGVITANVGSMYSRQDGTPGNTLYIKTSGTGNTGWDIAGATGANTALSNLASVAVNTSLLPGSDATIDLDSVSFRYNNSWWGGVVGWTNGAGVADTGLSRGLAGTINLGNGTNGDTSGTLQLGTAKFISSAAGVFGIGQGTAPSIGNFTGQAVFTAPTSVTAYFMMVPGAAGNGVLTFSSTVNQAGCTASATNLCGSFANIIIASGTASMPTASLSGGTCNSVVTVSASGVLSTDSIKWSYNAAPGTTIGNLVITPYVTTGNVNFLQCSPAINTGVMSASTINWEVVR
jgi:hypothetical protein